MRVVIPAAGRGTRFLPATRAVPKEMLPVVSKPIIEYVVEEVVAAGATDILLVTGYAKRAIEDYFDLGPKGGPVIHFIRQKEPLGLGDAIRLARSFTGNERFGVQLGDTIHETSVPPLAQLNNLGWGSNATVVLTELVPAELVSRYGIVEGYAEPEMSGTLRVTRVIEKPHGETESRLALTGAYIFPPAIYGAFDNLQPGANGEVQLTDAIQALIKGGLPVYAVPFVGTRYDIGDPAGLLRANLEFAHRDPALREKLHDVVRRWEFSSRPQEPPREGSGP